MKTTRIALMAALLAVAARGAPAQQPPPAQMQGGTMPTRGPGSDPLMGNLFPPELIMQNQEAIGLSEEQRSYIVGELQRTQSQTTGIQWRLQAAVERLGTIVRADHPDEGQALAQLDSVLALEKEMKRAQIGLLVRLKSRLTTEQQAALRQRMGRPGEE
jgi:Spy/CpxP family protein refolding chaperone